MEDRIWVGSGSGEWALRDVGQGRERKKKLGRWCYPSACAATSRPGRRPLRRERHKAESDSGTSLDAAPCPSGTAAQVPPKQATARRRISISLHEVQTFPLHV